LARVLEHRNTEQSFDPSAHLRRHLPLGQHAHLFAVEHEEMREREGQQVLGNILAEPVRPVIALQRARANRLAGRALEDVHLFILRPVDTRSLKCQMRWISSGSSSSSMKINLTEQELRPAAVAPRCSAFSRKFL
jgi:hypothetical protein